jgi:hypothetical protein
MIKKTMLLIILLWTFFSINSTYSQEKDKNIENWLPTMLGSSFGTEFYLTFHPAWEVTGGDNYNKIYVSSEVETRVTVMIEGKGFEQSQMTIPNGTIVFDLTPYYAQPYSKSESEKPEDDQVWKQFAVHVVADDPIICYGMTKFQYTSDGYLALPVNSYGKEYIVSSWSDIGDNQTQYLTSYSSAIAAYDKTRVRFTGGGPSFSETTTGIKVGESETYEMNRGDVLVMASLGSNSDLSGSKFTANNSITVISGNFCSYVPEFTPACDYLIEQELPTYTWGQTYCVTPIIGRQKASWIKIYAKNPGTLLYRDGKLFGELSHGGGAKMGDCYLSMRALEANEAPRPVVISSDKQISVTQYNTGQNDDGVPSDPFQMILAPMVQWSDGMMYSTLGVDGDGFARNYLNIVYQATDDGTIPEDFEFASVKNGEFDWKKMRSVYPDVGQELAVKLDDKRYFSKTITLPGEGVFKLRANTPFTASAYGFGDYVSYGMLASIGLSDNTKVDLEAPICDPVFDCYGVARDAANGMITSIKVTDMPDDDEIRSNLLSIVNNTSLSYNVVFNVQTFTPGESREAYWSAHVFDNSKEAQLVVLYIDRAGNVGSDTLKYFPDNTKIVAVDDSQGDFGFVEKGEVKELNYKIVNYSDEVSAQISYLKLLSDDTGYWTWAKYTEHRTGDAKPFPDEFKGDQGFQILDNSGNPIAFDIVIPPNGEYPFKVRFTATKSGSFQDSLGLGESESCFFQYWLPVKATVDNPIIEVSDVRFDTSKVYYTSMRKDVVIKNTGIANLEITDFTGPMLKDYNALGTLENVFKIYGLAEAIDKANGKKLTIQPGEEFTFQVAIKPMDVAFYKDSIVFESNATQSDPIAELSSDIINSIHEKLQTNLSVFPNPTSGLLSIESGDDGIIIESINLVDIEGNSILKKVGINNKSQQLNLEEFANGSYIIQITTNKGKIAKKITLNK